MGKVSISGMNGAEGSYVKPLIKILNAGDTTNFLDSWTLALIY